MNQIPENSGLSETEGNESNSTTIERLVTNIENSIAAGMMDGSLDASIREDKFNPLREQSKLALEAYAAKDTNIYNLFLARYDVAVAALECRSETPVLNQDHPTISTSEDYSRMLENIKKINEFVDSDAANRTPEDVKGTYMQISLDAEICYHSIVSQRFQNGRYLPEQELATLVHQGRIELPTDPNQEPIVLVILDGTKHKSRFYGKEDVPRLREDVFDLMSKPDKSVGILYKSAKGFKVAPQHAAVESLIPK